MNWLDEGALYSQMGMLLREDLGRGDITSQAIIARNTRARGRFIACEKMIVAGLEAAEEIFQILDSQQELEAFASDGEEVEGGKVIARMSGFADVLLAGERVAVNLIERLSSVATFVNQLVRRLEGTNTQIVDSRETTPGLRMLEKYAVLLGGGRNQRFGLDDGVLITSNHIIMTSSLTNAVREAKQKVGGVHRIQVQVTNESEMREALDAGADILLFEDMKVEDVSRLSSIARNFSPTVLIECSGGIDLLNVRSYAEAGADMISVNSLATSARPLRVSFRLQPF